MMRNTTFDKQPSSGKPERAAGRRATALAAAIILSAAQLVAENAQAAAPPPIPVAPGRAAPAPDFPDPAAGRPGSAGPGYLLPRAAPAARGTAPPVPHRVGAAGPAGGGGAVHIVREGESLWAVARLHADGDGRRTAQAMLEDILRANRGRFGTGGPDLIFPGERLLIPAYGTAAHG